MVKLSARVEAWDTRMGNKKPKALDSLLKRPNLNLEEVLEVEGVLNRARAGEASLLEYLSHESILQELICKMLQTSFPSAEKALKYPFLSCELLVVLSEPLIELANTQDGRVLQCIWDFLEGSNKVDQQTMSYVTRLLGSLFARNSKSMLNISRRHGGIPILFLRHLSSTPAADFLCRLIELETPNLRILQWLGEEENFFLQAMASIGPGFSETDHFALAHFVQGLLLRPLPEGYPVASLLHRFTEPNTMHSFLIAMMSSDDSGWRDGIDVLSCLCRRVHSATVELGGASMTHVLGELVSALVPYLNCFVSALESVNSVGYAGPSGTLPRLGMRRLKATRFLADFALLRSVESISELQRLQVTEKLLNLFFVHSQNTFLQGNVVEYFSALCLGDWNTNNSIIMDGALRAGRLLSRIIQSQKIADSLAEMPRRPRPNCMGHVTLLADQIHSLLDKHGAEMYRKLGDLLRRESWIEYSNKSYRETKLRDAYVLGGEQAPLQPMPTEDVFASVFTSAADESIVRYFCHEIISAFPPSLHLTDLDVFMEDAAGQDYQDEEDEAPHADSLPSPPGILGGTLLGNRGLGFENILRNDISFELEMELRFSSSSFEDDDLDVDQDSGDDTIFDIDRT